MYLLNFSLDNLSLMALTIAVGFVVDDAIVVVENIYRHIEDGMPRRSTAAIKGAREIGFTVLSISISLVAVFIPLLLMGGIIGRLFREFAITVTAAIAVSVVVSLTLTPMLCSRFLQREARSSTAASTASSRRASMRMLVGYRRMLEIVLRHQCDHAGRVLRHHGAHGGPVRPDPEGLLPDPGHRPDHRPSPRPRRISRRRR